MNDPFPLSTWERRFENIVEIVPYITLAASLAISLVSPDRPEGEIPRTLALTALALAWTVGARTLLPVAVRRRRTAVTVHFAGVLATAALLTFHDPIFIIYCISGFFLAAHFAPSKWTFAAVAATSFVLYGSTLDWAQATVQLIAFHLAIVAVQTVAIGGGHIAGIRIEDRQRKYRKALSDLQIALAENADLHAQLLTQAHQAGILDERHRMAREIHDTLAQGLTGIITQLRAAQRVESSGTHLELALGLAQDSLTEARRSVAALQPHQLEDAHLPDAMTTLARSWTRTTGVDLRVEVTGDRVPLSPAIEVTLFRVAQEALANVAKHADATRVGLTLSYTGSVVLLDVRDDGTGIRDPDAKGFGLNSMRQRLRGVGGSLEIESTPGEGTAVSATVPALQGNPR
ncbi:histidine kinase [Planomonospora parontospora subsp. parontospora]|uniref:Oxygen sensor histidine kinase NreB n=2 Tax=Planomonospora parontospora TaxID=58119 RepID=A0AA37F5T5_9ACTN|nr:sensor histidine kinase [Planomonospora parontospora]GGK79060.1 histidine kinase [Planomonospora parontospora]GII10248.1 histidine kinase [Planomonospora parontospora subsp. parontospora]